MESLFSQLIPSFFRKNTELETKIGYKVELNFKSTTQVIYSKKNQSQIEKFNSDFWEKEVLVTTEHSKIIRLRAFINTSNLHHSGEAKLSIFIENNLVSEKIFSIDFHQDYSGWLELTHKLS